MQITVYPLANNPLSINIPDTDTRVTIKHVFSQIGSGEVLGNSESTIMNVILDNNDSFSSYGSVHVNGVRADLGFEVHDGDTIMLIPNVEGGVSA